MSDDKKNTGNRNTGDCNAGNWNTGNRNTGNCNAGNWNTGNRNTGDCNAGNWNAGNRNTGNCNAGNWNTGNHNTGYWNTGDWNTGNCNAGNWNAGNRNTGNCNAGNWNTGNHNTGYFCENDGPVLFFDKPANVTRDDARALIPCVDMPCGAEWVPAADMTDAERVEWPAHKTTGGFLRKHELPIRDAFPLAWANMDDETRQRFIDLPNFDADKFERMVGVNVNAAASPPREIVIEGATYVLKRD